LVAQVKNYQKEKYQKRFPFVEMENLRVDLAEASLIGRSTSNPENNIERYCRSYFTAVAVLQVVAYSRAAHLLCLAKQLPFMRAGSEESRTA
jgi:hypothetical protein